MEELNKKTEKLTDKAFSRFLVTSVIGILVCIACLCSSTFAWFSSNNKSVSNTLATGKFDIAQPIATCEGTDGMLEFAFTEIDGIWSCELPAGTYTIVLTSLEGSNVKGHCVVTVGDGAPQNTDAIISAEIAARDGMEQSDPFTFTLTLDEAATVTIQSRWGMVAAPDIMCD